MDLKIIPYYIVKCFKKYAVFKGRASRTEYWIFSIPVEIAAYVYKTESKFDIGNNASELERSINQLDRALHPNWEIYAGIAGAIILATLVPYLAVTFRRMHDCGHNGLWGFVPIVNLVMCLIEGEKGSNQYGPDPRYEDQKWGDENRVVLRNGAYKCDTNDQNGTFQNGNNGATDTTQRPNLNQDINQIELEDTNTDMQNSTSKSNKKITEMTKEEILEMMHQNKIAIIAGFVAFIGLILFGFYYFGMFPFRYVTVNDVTFKMIKVNGNKDEGIGTYWIGETEVTWKLWNAVMGTEAGSEGENYPAHGISWYDCQEFIAKMNKMTGYHFSMPTSTQWIYAASCGGSQLSADRNIDADGWYDGNAGGSVREVTLKNPNSWGLYDIFGNVAEFSSDLTDPDELKAAHEYESVDPNDYAEARGGSFATDAQYCNANGYMYNLAKGEEVNNVGLRLVCTQY